jgi:tetratricopeptide (TPR) repeat protein
MRMSWRTYVLILLFGIWPHFGCHQVPGDKSVQDLRPIQQPDAAAKKQELTAADIAQSWIAKADKLEKDGKTSDAIVLCEKMREPGNPQALQATRKLALLYDRSHDLDRAEQEYQKVLLQNPKDADALAKLGDLANRRGQWGIAYKHFSNAVYYQPDHASAWSGLGMALAQEGNYDASFEAYSKVLSKSEAYCEVAFVMKLQGKLTDAIRAYETALKLEPAMPRARAELSKVREMDPESLTTMSPVKMIGQKGAVELVEPLVRVNEGTGRQMMQRPTLPPVPDFDLPPSGKNK